MAHNGAADAAGSSVPKDASRAQRAGAAAATVPLDTEDSAGPEVQPLSGAPADAQGGVGAPDRLFTLARAYSRFHMLPERVRSSNADGRGACSHNHEHAGGLGVRRRNRRLIFAVDHGVRHVGGAVHVLDGGRWGGPPALAGQHAFGSTSGPAQSPSRPQALAQLGYAGHTITCFAVAAEGRDMAVTGGREGELVAWNFKSETVMWRRQVHRGKKVACMEICGEYVVSGSNDNTVRCSKASTGAELWVYAGHSDSVSCLAVCGQSVISGSYGTSDHGSQGDVRCVHLSTGEEQWVYDSRGGDVNSLAVDGDSVIGGFDDATVRCVHARTGVEQWVYTGHIDPVRCVAVVGGYVVSGSDDATVRCIDLHTGAERWAYMGHRCPVRSVAACGRRVISGSSLEHRGDVRCVDVLTGEEQWAYAGFNYTLRSVAVCDNCVISGSSDHKNHGDVRCLGVSTGAQQWVHERRPYTVMSAALSGGFMVIGSDDCTLRCCDARTGAELWIYGGHSDTVNSVALNGSYAVSGSDDSTVRCVDVSSGSERWVYNGGRGSYVRSVVTVDK